MASLYRLSHWSDSPNPNPTWIRVGTVGEGVRMGAYFHRVMEVLQANGDGASLVVTTAEGSTHTYEIRNEDALTLPTIEHDPEF